MIFDRQSGRHWWQIHEGILPVDVARKINDARIKVRNLIGSPGHFSIWWFLHVSCGGRGGVTAAVNIYTHKKYSHCILCKKMYLRRKPKNRGGKFVDWHIATWVDGKDHVFLVMDERWGCGKNNECIKKTRCLFYKSIMSIFCKKECFVGWRQCKIEEATILGWDEWQPKVWQNQWMCSCSSMRCILPWSSLYQMIWNEHEWARMKPWGCTHEKRRQDRTRSVSGPAGSTNAAFDGAGLAGPFFKQVLGGLQLYENHKDFR